MNEARDFLEAIGEAPDDDTPRLIYADWLEEHGDPDRAAFIRHQCAAAAAREAGDDETYWTEEALAWQLRRRHGKEWAGPWAEWASEGEFGRGFVSSVALHGGKGTRPREECATVQSVKLGTNWIGRREKLEGFEELGWRPGQIRSLDLGDAWNRHGQVDAVLKHPACSRLAELCLNGRDYRSGETLQLVQNLPHLRQLETLRFQYPVSADPPSFLSSRLFAKEFPLLRGLDISLDWLVTGHDFRELVSRRRDDAGPVLMDQLSSLDITGMSLLLPDILRPGWAPNLVRLKASAGPTLREAPLSIEHMDGLSTVSIELASHQMTQDQIATLIVELIRLLETLPSLERLTLTGPLNSRSLEALARANFLRLRSLRLAETSIASLAPLRRAPWLPGLRELSVGGIAIDVPDRGLRDLFDSDALSGLRFLRLSGLSLKGAEAESLVRSSALQGLRVLALRHAGLSPSALAWLARREALPELALLDLSWNDLPREAKAPLRKRRGAALRLGRHPDENWWTRTAYDGPAFIQEKGRDDGPGPAIPRD